jgi:hypothetical protein
MKNPNKVDAQNPAMTSLITLTMPVSVDSASVSSHSLLTLVF